MTPCNENTAWRTDMSQRRVIKLPDGKTLTFLIATNEEFEVICDELEAAAETVETGEMPWEDREDREALESARRERRLPKMPRGAQTERLFSRLEVETTYLSVAVTVTATDSEAASASASGHRITPSL
jgi:hypothetical protein